MSAVEVTRFIKSDGSLTKRLALSPDAKLISDGSRCRMTTGRAERVRLDDWRNFAALIDATPCDTAWALGTMRPELGDAARVVLKDDSRAGKGGHVARSADFFAYRPGEPAFVLLDYDTKGMPDAVGERIATLGGFVGALASICPGIANAGYVRRASTSADVSNGETGESYPSSGEHVYLLVGDGSDAERFLSTLHKRAWLAGLGWHVVGKAGQLLDRSIVDRAVAGAERLVFEAPPDLEQPLVQRPRKAIVHG
jgi:hypothetical protein